METERSLTLSQVARRLELSSARVNELRRQGKLRAAKTPLGYLFPEAEIDAYARARKEARAGAR